MIDVLLMGSCIELIEFQNGSISMTLAEAEEAAADLEFQIQNAYRILGESMGETMESPDMDFQNHHWE